MPSQVAQGTGLGPKIAPDTQYAQTGSEMGTPSSSGIPPPIDWPEEKKDHFAEVDIFVPSAPPSGTPTSTIASPTTNDKKDDHENDDSAFQGGPGDASSGGGPTYDDLAARFQMLKK